MPCKVNGKVNGIANAIANINIMASSRGNIIIDSFTGIVNGEESRIRD